jgi:hypothetical protein
VLGDEPRVQQQVLDVEPSAPFIAVAGALSGMTKASPRATGKT